MELSPKLRKKFDLYFGRAVANLTQEARIMDASWRSVLMRHSKIDIPIFDKFAAIGGWKKSRCEHCGVDVYYSKDEKPNVVLCQEHRGKAKSVVKRIATTSVHKADKEVLQEVVSKLNTLYSEPDYINPFMAAYDAANMCWTLFCANNWFSVNKKKRKTIETWMRVYKAKYPDVSIELMYGHPVTRSVLIKRYQLYSGNHYVEVRQ